MVAGARGAIRSYEVTIDEYDLDRHGFERKASVDLATIVFS